jgi:hypothetical protein
MILIRQALVLTALFLVCVYQGLGMCAQSRNVPYDGDLGFSFSQVAVDFRFPDSYKRMESVDFGNLAFRLFDDNKRVQMKVQLTRGVYEEKSTAGYENIKLDSVHLSQTVSSNQQYALVVYKWTYAGGSSNTESVAQLYKLEDQHLKLIQQLNWDEHFDTKKPYVIFHEKSGTLTVRTAHYLSGGLSELAG